jgi:hypothetical protein
MGRSIGHGMREFKDSVTGDKQQPPAVEPPLAEPVRIEREHAA